MTVKDMRQVRRNVRYDSGGLHYVRQQLHLALTKLAQEETDSGIESPYGTVKRLWHAWTNACHGVEVRGYFVRQWWMHSGALRENGVSFSGALGQLTGSNQFDAAQVRRHGRRESHERGPVSDTVGCAAGQSAPALEKIVQKLLGGDEATVELMMAAITDLREAVKEQPLTHASLEERKRLLAPLASRFRDAFMDAMDVADPDCRRQVATNFFGTFGNIEAAVESGSATGLLAALKTLLQDLRQVAFHASFEHTTIERALDGMLKMVGEDFETASRIVVWLSMDVTEALRGAYGTLMKALDTPGEARTFLNMVDVMFKLQTQD
jgi:hypothetical protein